MDFSHLAFPFALLIYNLIIYYGDLTLFKFGIALSLLIRSDKFNLGKLLYK